MLAKRIALISYLLTVFTLGCGIMNPDQGALKIVLVKDNKVGKSTRTLRELRDAQFFLLQGSHSVRCNDLLKEDNYYSIEIANLPPASDYSVLLFGKEYHVGYIDVCAEQTGIEIKNGEVSTVQLSWSPFMTEPIAPAEGGTFGSNTIKLKWKLMNESSYYLLTLADDSTFSRPSIYTRVNGDDYEIDTQLLQKGKYYWKVRCMGRWHPRGPGRFSGASTESHYCAGAWSRISHFIYE